MEKGVADMREAIGMLLALLGIAAADSEILLIPVALIAAGAYLLRGELR